MSYLIECRDGPAGYWYILGSCRLPTDAKYHADRYRRMLFANGCEIRVTYGGQVVA